MRSCTQSALQAFFILAFVGTFALWEHKANQWDFLMFTQQWPVAACTDINDTQKHVCFLNQNISTWTIHGIWPSRYKDKGPFYCNTSNPFIESSIKDLEPLLGVRWPNLIQGTPKTSFWKHEWIKHGTCSTNLPALSSEHKYFYMGLNLNKKFDLYMALKQKDISPSSEKRYKLSDIRVAIELFTGTTVNIQCIFSKDKSEQALIQVELCVNSTFTTVNCSKSSRTWSNLLVPSWDDIPYNPVFEECEENLPTQYLPFPKP